MAQFRKKPVVIDAVQWLNKKIVVADDGSDPLEWFFQAERNNTIQLAGDTLIVKTLEGEMRAQPGDWIIRGVKGEIYPCKPDIFEATYEPVL